MEQNNLLKPPKAGEIIKGKIISFSKSAVYLDLGALGTGIIFGREFYAARDALKKQKVGAELFAKVTDPENEDGYTELSFSEAGKELGWVKLERKKENDETITVKILGANKGGLLAEIDRIQGFLPVSQLSSEHYPRVESADKTKILQKLQKLIGQDLEVKIFDLDPKEEKLIFSEKATNTEKLKEILKNYKVDDVVEGEITGIVDFGAFIKIGPELEGLIHISELDWKLIENPSEAVQTGQKVKAKIIEITKDGRISLSLKALKKDPWQGMEKKYKKGDVTKGKVTKFNLFGAFVEITPYSETKSLDEDKDRSKIQGLAHISEFGTQAKMGEKLKIGESYDFQILQIDPEEHRMSLRLVEN